MVFLQKIAQASIFKIATPFFFAKKRTILKTIDLDRKPCDFEHLILFENKRFYHSPDARALNAAMDPGQTLRTHARRSPG